MVKWYDEGNLARLAGVPVARDLWLSADHKINISQECDMGPRRKQGLLGSFPNPLGAKSREGRSCLHSGPSRPHLVLRKLNYLTQHVLFRKSNQEWWSIWKLSHLRNMIILFKITTQVPPIYIILLTVFYFLIAFFSPANMQHKLLLHEFIACLPPWAQAFFYGFAHRCTAGIKKNAWHTLTPVGQWCATLLNSMFSDFKLVT